MISLRSQGGRGCGSAPLTAQTPAAELGFVRGTLGGGGGVGGGLPLHTLLPEAVQARGLQVHTVNSAQDLVHGRVYGLPLVGLQAWQRGVFVDDAWAVLHQVEGGADDAGGDTDGVGHFSGRQPWCPPPSVSVRRVWGRGGAPSPLSAKN